MAADLQRVIGRDAMRKRQHALLEARLDGDLIPTLDRDGNGVDRVEYVIGMLTHMGIVSWAEIKPFLDQFDAMDVDRSGHLDRHDLEKMREQQEAAMAERLRQAARVKGGATATAVLSTIRVRREAKLRKVRNMLNRRRPSEAPAASASAGAGGGPPAAAAAPGPSRTDASACGDSHSGTISAAQESAV